jgi:hypothetical protein
MSLEGSWKRGRPSKGLRQINLRYLVDDPKFQEIEDLLERVPYKQVNTVMRQALLLGSKILLSASDQGPGALNISPAPSTPPTPYTPATPLSQEHAPSYSRAAQSMFNDYGDSK